jgi:serine/threonine-protein kinase RsbW
VLARPLGKARMRDHLVIELQGNLSEIPTLAGRIEAFGARNKIPQAAIGQINLALDELLTNTMSYGFDSAGSRRIAITLRIDDGIVAVEVLDGGTPYDPFARPDPDVTQPIEKRPIGGLGVFFVRKLMDRVDYERVNGQNRVTLVKNTNAPGP